ncbi:YceI family protein [Xanthomonadaceae bacterium JHOS43]|nr:YceI family protein [Xanthomonadaceae bacterium JHOS43]MCX7563888.1 YceI family protein [Xanthomonadaceae bacterium XH05]
MLHRLSLVSLALFAMPAIAAPVNYVVDSSHTYPSFEADHLGGVSTWRGKFNSSSGSVTMDRDAGTGEVEIVIDAASIDFGHDGMNDHARRADILDVEQFPAATYRGKLVDFVEGNPTRVDGELTLRGVTRSVPLTIHRFKCIEHPRSKKEVCGADASASFQRDDFGIDYAKAGGFDMGIVVRVQIEVRAAD